MKTIQTLVVTIVVIVLLSGDINAQYSNLGSSGAQFLEIPVGARAAGLGGAYMGLADDVNSVFWNPAGITKIRGTAASFSYMNWFDLFDHNSAAISFDLDDIGSIAVHTRIFSMEKVEITTEQDPNGTGRFFDAQDVAIGVTYARNLSEQFSVGITAKYVGLRIWNETASGIAFDVGTQYKLDFSNMVIAMSMSNFGADMQFDGEDLNITYDKDDDLPKNRLTPARYSTEEFPLPLSFQVGIAFDLFKTEYVSMKGAIDAVHPNDNNERVNLGGELNFFDRVFLRGGYRYNYDDEGITFGAGANVPLETTWLQFDYGYSVYDILPSVHRITMGIKF